MQGVNCQSSLPVGNNEGLCLFGFGGGGQSQSLLSLPDSWIAGKSRAQRQERGLESHSRVRVESCILGHPSPVL